MESSEVRTLAAIVFTDVAGFARVAEKDEARAHRLLKRDFALMEEIAVRHRGRIANTMGDGLLLVFPSALDAMAAALETQRALHDQALRLAPPDVLRHRMGVHLGDVVGDGADIFGEGVNVAARLEREAKPGGIAYSRTVHDLVKNKLTIPATYLGPRALKNIEERIPIWAVPPIGEPVALATEAIPLRSEEGAAGGKAVALIATAFALVAVTVVGVLALPKATPPPAPPPTPAPVVRDPVATEPAKPEPTTPADPVPVIDPFLEARRTYDFAAAVTALRARPSTPETEARIASFESLGAMRAWMDSSLAAATPEKPLAATVDFGEGPKPYRVTATPDGLAFDDGTAPVVRKFAELPPSAVADLATALAADPATPPDAVGWIATFRAEYAE